jgi:hypothetical protein
MEFFQGMVLVVNPSAMIISGTQNMTHTANSFSIGSNFNLKTARP